MTYKNLVAHKERNLMTSLMVSQILGFVTFLSIVARIPNARDFQNTLKEYGS